MTEHSNEDAAGKPEGRRDDAREGDVVGFKKPPLHSQYQKGQSGNPQGRPKGSKNHKDTINRVLAETVQVTEGGRSRAMTKFEAIAQMHAAKAVKGDVRSARFLAELAIRAGVLDPALENGSELPVPGDNGNQNRPGDQLFQNIDPRLLSTNEKIELSRLAEIVDRDGDVVALSTEQFERLKVIRTKARTNNTLH